ASDSNSWFQSSIARLDKDFTLGIGETKEITITVDVTETTLKNLNNDTLIVELIVWARSETVSDAANAVLQVTLQRIDGEAATSGDEASSGFPIEEIALWVVFLVVIAGGAFVILSILRTEEEEDEFEKWGEEGYEDSLSATYGAVAAAPSIPASMPTPAPAPIVVAPAPAAPVDDGMPPLPAGGLPAGWTMEQWKHYGQQWLDQNQQ
ncbi:MAG: hypothetical protein O3C36_02320, partial [archaeon]|nr:hypothetical protein [archaeon]